MIPIILDVDTGYDDALALLLALRSPALRVLGITCAAGNHGLSRVIDNTLKILDVANAPRDLPVAAGVRQPLVEALRPPAVNIHGVDGMADIGLPSPDRSPVVVHAIELLRALLTDADTPVRLVALAPLTNLALFIRLYPDLAAAKVSGVTLMGGAYLAHGNTNPVAEFNIRQDPEASRIVLDSGLPITLYPLDPFRSLTFSLEESRALVAHPSPSLSVAGRILVSTCATMARATAMIGDAGAVATVIAPDEARTVRLPLTVELMGEATRGMTVIDRRPAPQRGAANEWWTPSPTQVDVVTEVDVAAYQRLFVTTLADQSTSASQEDPSVSQRS